MALRRRKEEAREWRKGKAMSRDHISKKETH